MHNFMHRFHNQDLAILIVRITLAIIFIYAGWGKISNLEMTAGFFSQSGLPGWTAGLVGYCEFIGGIAFLVGYLVRYFAVITAIITVVAIFKVHWPVFALPTGYEFALVAFLLSVATIAQGSGRYSLAGWLYRRKQAQPM